MLRMASRRRLNASGLNHQSSPVTCRSWAIVASHEDWSYSQGIVLGGVGGSETGPGAVPPSRPVLGRMGTGFHVLTGGIVGVHKSPGCRRRHVGFYFGCLLFGLAFTFSCEVSSRVVLQLVGTLSCSDWWVPASSDLFQC